MTVTASVEILIERQITLEASRGRVNYRGRFTLSGQITSEENACVSGQSVMIQRTVVGRNSVSTFDEVTSNADGSYSKSYRGDRGANYIAHLDVNGRCSLANSGVRPVLVRPLLSLAANKGRGAKVRLVTRLTPCAGHANTVVMLRKNIRGVIGKVKRTRLSGSCTATFVQKINKKSVFQTRWPKQDEAFLGAKSRSVSIRPPRQ